MTHFDVFNGDADGLCALVQLRLHQPVHSVQITGVKRDIALLARVDASQDDRVTVLDISLDKNREALLRILASGAHVHYFDHHFAGELPAAANFFGHIDTSADTCTSLLVNAFLKDFTPAWAVTGAFGDNLNEAAQRLAARHPMAADEISTLAELGTLLNYNAYGESEQDLHVPPRQLFQHLLEARTPLAFVRDDALFLRLRNGYDEDMQRAEHTPAELLTHRHGLYIFPDEPWARRVSGVFANRLARTHPDRAHALLTQRANGDFLVSVRAPLNRKTGADTLCRRFATGGGRAAAAGINRLAADQYEAFVTAFTSSFN